MLKSSGGLPPSRRFASFLGSVPVSAALASPANFLFFAFGDAAADLGFCPFAADVAGADADADADGAAPFLEEALPRKSDRKASKRRFTLAGPSPGHPLRSSSDACHKRSTSVDRAGRAIPSKDR